MIDINVTGGNLSEAEIQYCISEAREKYPDKVLRAVDLELDGNYVNAKYSFADIPFQRIRRITGYLVGTLDRFNNAKRAEEKSRVKHEVM